MTNSPRKKLLTTVEAAAFIGMQPGTLELWRFQGRGPRFMKIGRAVRYSEDLLEDFLAQSVRASTSE